MSNVLEQAQAAAQQNHWSLLTQYLQQIVTSTQAERSPSTEDAKPSKTPLFPSPTLDLEPLLALALEVLKSGDFQDRWEIVRVIGQLGTAAIAPVVAVLQDEEADLEQRWFAIRILGELNSPEAIAPLLEVLKTCDREELSAEAAHTIANLGSATIDALASLLPKADSRPFATAALAQIRRPETIEPLLSVVKDPLPEIRVTALEALSSFHDPRIVPVLVEALQDPAAAVRKEAVIGLSIRPYLNGQLDLVNLLKPLLWDLRWEVCQQAAIALSRLKTDAAVAALSEILESPTPPIPLKIEAVRALGWMETATALAALQQALIRNEPALANSQPSILPEIATVLGRVQQPELKVKAAEGLVNFLTLNHSLGDRTLKQAVATALGQLGDPKAIAALIPLLADSDASVRLHCVVALKQLNLEQARQQLEHRLAENPTPELRQGIATALQELGIHEVG